MQAIKYGMDTEASVRRTDRRQPIATEPIDRAGGWLRAALPWVGAALAAFALLAAPGLSRAATYKWVDDKGVVHYSDKLPPEGVNKGNVELNSQGVPIRKTDPALTPEQRRAREIEDERRRQSVREEEEFERRDRALLASYTSEGEIELARNRALKTIEDVVQSAIGYSEQLTKRKVVTEAKKADYRGKPVPVAIESELESVAVEIARQADLIAQKKREAVAVNAKYDADKKRWRELVAAKGGAAATAAGAANGNGARAGSPSGSPVAGVAAIPKK